MPQPGRGGSIIVTSRKLPGISLSPEWLYLGKQIEGVISSFPEG